MPEFNVAYEHEGVTKLYCMYWCDADTAIGQLINFYRLYGDGVKDLRPYPNGKGFYSFSNARIVRRG